MIAQKYTTILLLFAVFLLGCSERTEPSNFTMCVSGNLIAAEKTSSLATLEEICEYNHEVQLTPLEIKALQGRGVVWNKPSKEQSGGDPLAYFDVDITNENLDWRITSITIRVTLNKKDRVEEEHNFRVRIKPGAEASTRTIMLRNRTTIENENWSWGITEARGVRLSPVTSRWSDRFF